MKKKPVLYNIITTVAAPKIKEPPCYDVSVWQGQPVWANVSPRPLLVICKGTEGDMIRDKTFLYNFDDLRKNGIARGAYHFHRKAITPFAQAKNFVDFVKPVLMPSDFIALDVEEGGETAEQLITWLDLVEKVLKNQILIYSTKRLLEAIPVTPAQAQRLKQYKTWIAGYPYFPNAYNTIPAGYIPDPKRFGKPWLWQYAEGTVSGVQGSKCDFNWIDPELQAVLSTPIEHTKPFAEVDEYKQVVNGVTCHISVINLSSDVRFAVRHFDGALGLVSQAARLDGAQVAFNGQDYDKTLPAPHDPKGLAVADGVQYTPQQDFQYFLDVSPMNVITSAFKGFTNFYNTTSFIRMLVLNGQPNPDFAANPGKIEYTEIHARSALGHRADGKMIQIIAEGKVNVDSGIAYQGITLPQLANLFIQYEAVFAGEHGGGGEKYIKDQMVNTPSDPQERPVVQVLQLFINGGSPMSQYYEIRSTDSKNHTVRSTYSIKGGAVTSITPADVGRGGATETPEDIYIYPSDVTDLSIAGGFSAKKGDKWRRVFQVNGAAVVGWTAEIHLGVVQGISLTLKDDGTIPPPVDGAFALLDIAITDPISKKKYGATGIKLPETP